MDVKSLVVFAVALGIAAGIPGPGVLAVVSCAIGRGLKAALMMTGGLVIGDLVYFTAAILGMAALAHSMGELFFIVKLAGAAYLIWLGIKLWRAKGDLAPVPTRAPADGGQDDHGAAARRMPRSHLGNLLAGLGVTLGNPKTIAFYAGLLPTFIDLQHLTLPTALAMAGIVVLLVGGIIAAYALVAAQARGFLGNRRYLRIVNRTAGTMMIGAGVTVATQ
ncbi:MAG TPA: LysE family translocator [Dongiaceae bacterium]|nr:LysE family translocator [Dongiaceae bacterium]